MEQIKVVVDIKHLGELLHAIDSGPSKRILRVEEDLKVKVVVSLLELVVVHDEQGHALVLRFELKRVFFIFQTLVFLRVLLKAVELVLWHVDHRHWELNLTELG